MIVGELFGTHLQVTEIRRNAAPMMQESAFS